jgi:hypothetical protein
MWKFLPGVSKPESKWKVDTRESNKAYNATKRKRTFQPHWLQKQNYLNICLLLTFFNLWNQKSTLFWHNICTSHTFKTYSECRILHVITVKTAVPRTWMARTDLKVPSIFLIFLSKKNLSLEQSNSINGPVNNKITSFTMPNSNIAI